MFILIDFFHTWYGVGQGLFSCGRIRDGNRDFLWIFDCGTSGPSTVLQEEISGFCATDSTPVGILCISHFDEDHINGVARLLKLKRVEKLILPYYPLIDRLSLAIKTGSISNSYLSFLVDPAGFMAAAGGENLGEVILISGGTDSSEDSGFDNSPQVDPENWDFIYPDTKRRDIPPEDIHGVSDESFWPEVRVFSHEKPFKIGMVWEFMFYNAHRPIDVADNLRREVVAILTASRKPDGIFEGQALIPQLKKLYDEIFGSSAYARNLISLVCYTGPKYPITKGILFAQVDNEVIGVEDETSSDRDKMSLIYFADFPLTSSKRLQKIRNHFSARRWNLVNIIQVPHHGSIHSWFAGASQEFSHVHSVISSKWGSRRFPSKIVVNDLASHNVTLAYEHQRANFGGLIFWITLRD